MKKIVHLPFPLPTWNRLLSINRWERKKIRDWIHGAVSMCCQDVSGSQTQMVYQPKQPLTELSLQNYYMMIRGVKSKKSLTRRRSVRRKKKKP